MALTQVVPRLRSHGLAVDCCAWYPWRHKTTAVHGQHLGFDSCGIFHIGGTVEVKPTWGLSDIPFLTAVADGNAGEGAGKLTLHVYEGHNCPGQHWSCYRFQAYKESHDVKNLARRLNDMLTPSTAVAELERARSMATNVFCPYLRLHQKAMDQSEWLSGKRKMHNGAHFPLCVFTKNASARSKEAQRRRVEKQKTRWKVSGKEGGKGKAGAAAEKGKTAVAEPKGKGGAAAEKGKTAVAEPRPQSTWNEPKGKGGAGDEKGKTTVEEPRPQSNCNAWTSQGWASQRSWPSHGWASSSWGEQW